MNDTLKEKLSDGSAVGAVIGLGYVGLPLAHHLLEAGYRVLGFDVDADKVGQLNAGQSYIEHIPDAWIKQARDAGRFEATADFARLAEADCISICVPTPLDENQAPDLRFVTATADAIAKVLRPEQLIILESTTYPGTTVEMLAPILEQTDRKVGKDFFLVFSPEREDPGNQRFTIKDIPKVVGGVTPECTELARLYYGRVFDQMVPVSTPAVAELSKLLENIFRSVNIALVNELKILCQRMDIDVWEVIQAAASKPFGFMPFYPGPGLGGHCIPIDPFYLSWKARQYDFHTRFIELAGEINTHMPGYVVSRIMEALNDRGKPLKGSRILLLGMAYKKDVGDTRESPALKIYELLQQRGAEVQYNDPHVPVIPKLRDYSIHDSSVELTKETLNRCDCAVIITDHSGYDYELIVDETPLVVDTRNATAKVSRHRDRIVKA